MNELLGKKVIIYSINGVGEVRDVGILESMEGQWIRLKKADNEVLFFCTTMIRLIKPFDPM